MLQFYKDALLTRPVSDGNPVWIFAPLKGAAKRISLWLADTDPDLTYTGNLVITPRGPLSLSLKRYEQARYGVAGSALVYPALNAASGDVPLARVDIEVRVPAGETAEINTVWLATGDLAVNPGALVAATEARFRIVRSEQGLNQRFRLYPEQRRVLSAVPGFRYGEYRWRGQEETNAQPIIPSRWDLDTDAIGREKFIAGIGHGLDLEPVVLEQDGHSVRARIRSGFYFTGTERYYLPGENAAYEYFSPDALVLELAGTPRAQSPIFVGAFKIDHEQYYDAAIRYEFMCDGFDAQGPEYQFTFDRAARRITLNKSFTLSRQFLGVAPQASQAVFDMPVWPAAHISQVFLGARGERPDEQVLGYELNHATGELTVSFADPLLAVDRDIYVDCMAEVVVAFEAGPSQDLRVPVDLNPAFAGISSGFIYLEHRKHRSRMIELYADKPRIITPRGYTMVSDLVSFGPVFYESDFALLQAVAFGERSGEAVAGARLAVVPGGLFRGLINYQDPNLAQVTVVTGGDGKAAFVYTPPDAFGQYLAPTSIDGADVLLPAPLPIQQLWNVDEGWLARLYSVFNTDAFFGKVGAQVEYGEIPWQVSGVAGTIGYRTNGRRVMFKYNNQPVLPVEAYDAADKPHDDPDFDGNVVRLTFATAAPVSETIGSYFLTYVGRVTLQVQALDSGVLSNTILLDLQTPPEVVDDSGVAGYLRPSAGGRLNIQRLGGAAVLPMNVNVSRY